MSVDRILLTNDDGVDAAGLRALYDALADEYAVTVVAPADDQSSVGRRLSEDVAVADHELGYVVEGTPVDCVVAGLDELVPDADAVVAGCNEGANLGAYTLGRSGTVSAAVEAAFFDVPAVATSMYVPGGDDWWKREFEGADFAHAVRATRFLVDEAVGAGVFDRADYLNVNAPIADEARAPLRVTTPSTWYGMRAERNGDGRVGFSDPIWGRMNDGDVPDPVGTDRRAVVDGEVSVSPLSVPHAAEPNAGLDELADAYEAAVRS
ncbi:5'/3'-nucleotidase SurE [Halorubrum trapanicum]|uniref:5'/3'-nucleotidase SurE n=1 Tax=Halorubrum trapanicum TaxID=29284 RepID=UPI000BBA6A2E|nr:5'/3'-nucleotidase SurE [Halorubrum trapanicum]